MPTFNIFGYKFFFFSNEFVSTDKLEPVHIHVTKGDIGKNAPKWWIGYNKINQCDISMASKYDMDESDIKKIEEILINNTGFILDMWNNFYKGYEIEIHNSVK